MKTKVLNINKSYGKTIMIDNYSFKFSTSITWEVELEDDSQLDELNKRLQEKVENLVNNDILRNQDVMSKLTGGKNVK
jgi:hypothetical protein